MNREVPSKETQNRRCRAAMQQGRQRRGEGVTNRRRSSRCRKMLWRPSEPSQQSTADITRKCPRRDKAPKCKRGIELHAGGERGEGRRLALARKPQGREAEAGGALSEGRNGKGGPPRGSSPFQKKRRKAGRQVGRQPRGKVYANPGGTQRCRAGDTNDRNAGRS